MELNICHLYPDVLNLYGDRGNIACMKKRLEWRGIGCAVTELPLGTADDLTGYDLFFIGGGQDFEQTVLLADLRAGRAENIRAAAEDGKTLLCICGGYQLLGNGYRTAAGQWCDYTGILDFTTEGSYERLIGNYAYRLGEESGGGIVIGFENHGGRTRLALRSRRSVRCCAVTATTARTARRVCGTKTCTAPTATVRSCRRTRRSAMRYCAARSAANTARPSSRLSTTAPRRPPGRSCSQDCTFSKGRAFIMRNYEQELENRVAFIRQLLKESGCEGIVYGNSGGKDSALVGILCKKACGNTVGILLPCATTQNYGSDTDDAIRVAEQYGIAYRTVDLSETRGALVAALEKAGVELNNAAVSNIAPRLRMTALYAVAAAEHRLVAGTGNRSEAFMGYAPSGATLPADFNPIADLSVTEVFEFLDYLDAPGDHPAPRLPPPGFSKARRTRRKWASPTPPSTAIWTEAP